MLHHQVLWLALYFSASDGFQARTATRSVVFGHFFPPPSLQITTHRYPRCSLFSVSPELEDVGERPDSVLNAGIPAPSPTDGSIQAPQVADILRIAIPAIGIWLCNPLLSMIDTSTVGLFAGTAQQAALNPAVSVTDYSARLMVSVRYIGLEALRLLTLTNHAAYAGFSIHRNHQLGRCLSGE